MTHCSISYFTRAFIVVVKGSHQAFKFAAKILFSTPLDLKESQDLVIDDRWKYLFCYRQRLKKSLCTLIFFFWIAISATIYPGRRKNRLWILNTKMFASSYISFNWASRRKIKQRTEVEKCEKHINIVITAHLRHLNFIDDTI